MAAQAKQVPLKGSDRSPVPSARLIGPANPDEQIEVTIRLRPRTPLPSDVQSPTWGARLPKDRRYLTRAQLAALYGATPEDIAKVEAFARANNLVAVHISQPRRSVVLSGTVADFSAAFGVQLEQYELPQGGTFRGRTGPIMIPADLDGIVVGVFGLDNRPQAQPHFRIGGGDPPIAGPAASDTSFTPTQLSQLYDFPANLDGTGECIAIIELGGGFQSSDLQAYFSALGLPAVDVSSVSVDNGANSPTGSPDGPDAEVMLDIEVAGAIAPGAKIVVYFCPNTDQGFLDAVTQAIHDDVNNPSVVSISWGGPEANWTAQATEQFDEAFQEAGAIGVTICVAAGDGGSSDGLSDGLAHVDFPASSPNALGCGGTRLSASGTSISSEVVWNDGAGGGATGGGVSDQFPLPSYQDGAGVPPSANPSHNIGRGVPDVAADADPNTGYQVRVDGQALVVGGTSAVAPLWAGLVARLNQGLGRPVGFLNPLLYGSISREGVFRDITSGNNGAYSAGPGWDACSGWGVADGTKLLQALSQ
jgi:kumamolisin